MMTTRQQTSSVGARRAPTTLGRDGPRVSPLALGTMTFGAETDESVAHAQLDLFVERGGTFVDSADVYASGESERMIGRWLRRRGGADGLVLATKGRFAPPSGERGASRRALTASVEGSLGRLQVDTIDLYSVHGWDPHTPMEETLGALGELVEAGKIRHVGFSNVTGWQLQRIVSAARHAGLPVPVALQPQYNLLDRGIELEVLPCCLEEGVALTPWSPLGGGWLTGKYRRDERPTGDSRLGDDPARGVEAYDLRNTGRTFRVLDALHGVASRLERPPAHVALAWLLARPGVASVLLGARTVGQLEDNLAAADLVLAADDVAALSAVSASGLPPYPYAFVRDWCDVDVWDRLGTATP